MNYGIKLTPELELQILAMIRQGAFVHDAFRAVGIPDKVTARWLDPKHQRGQFYDLQNKIKQAGAIARSFASIDIKKADPFKWAANGPGRDLPGEPGYAAMTNPAEPKDLNKIDPLQFPEFMRFVNNVRIVMAMFPEARKMLDELMLDPVYTPALGSSADPQ